MILEHLDYGREIQPKSSTNLFLCTIRGY